ncbi:hypothetical protein J6590_078333 [Homalodisca vitripennis]|nr:hypothetical protein J6590_078333 [Homalodisca vitripennis]
MFLNSPSQKSIYIPKNIPSSEYSREFSLQEAMWTAEQTDRERRRDETEVATTTPRRRHGGTPTALVWIAMPVSREVVMRSKSRQDSHSRNSSSHSSLEDIAQRVELSPLEEESPDVSIEELKVNEHDERFVQSGNDRTGSRIHQVSTMAETRGPSITPPKFRGSLEENLEHYLHAFESQSLG